MPEIVPEVFYLILGAAAFLGVLAAIVLATAAARRRRARRVTPEPVDAPVASTRRLERMTEQRLQDSQERLQEPLPRARGKTVVLADDDPALSRSLAVRLESLGLTVIRSSNAMDALLGTHRVAPNLVILDVAMPSGSGMAVCEMLAADPQSSGIPVIILTGSSDAATIARCKRLGARYLKKSADIWDQLRPLAIELLGLESEEEETPPPREPEQANEPDQFHKSDPLIAMLASDPSPEGAELKDAKVLCIDDHAEACERVAQQLRPYGIRVMAASDVESGYMMCYSEKPDAILLDTETRGGKYQEALTRLRSHPFVSGVPIILVGPPRDTAAAREMGALKGLRYLAKPLDAEELVRELRNHASFAGTEPPHAPKRNRNPVADISPSLRQDTPKPPEPVLGEQESEDAATVAEESHSPAEGRNRPRVLVIDDDPSVSRAIAVRLRPLGVDVFHAFNGMQGYWTGLDVIPDVIISDLKMPDGEGNYILSRFRSHPLTKDVPMIVLTGETNPAVKRTMLSLGVAAYFTKPWSFDELLRELGTHIDLRPASADRTHVPSPV